MYSKYSKRKIFSKFIYGDRISLITKSEKLNKNQRTYFKSMPFMEITEILNKMKSSDTVKFI